LLILPSCKGDILPSKTSDPIQDKGIHFHHLSYKSTGYIVTTEQREYNKENKSVCSELLINWCKLHGKSACNSPFYTSSAATPLNLAELTKQKHRANQKQISIANS